MDDGGDEVYTASDCVRGNEDLRGVVEVRIGSREGERMRRA